MIKIYSHNYGKGSKLLAKALGCKLLKKQNSMYRPRHRDYIINWGATDLPRKLFDAQLINHPASVKDVVNKRNFFTLYWQTPDNEKTFNAPRAFFNRQDAAEFMFNNPGRSIVCRTVLRGHEGIGIVIADTIDQLVVAQLYTEYVKKKAEYRVHVIDGKVVDAVQKKKKKDYDGGRDTRIRNTANGYVFARTDIVVPESVLTNAVNSVKFYGLDFGAVDVVYNEYQDRAYVLEINTAPGIEGRTVESYANAFRNWLR